MAIFDQPITTYTDTTNHRRVISDQIYLIDPRDTPLLAALGGLSGARGKFNLRENGYKIEILEDEMPYLSGACNATTTIATDATNFTVSDASVFQDGHVILIDSEYMVIKAADVTGNTVTVYSRSYGGTNATHASTSAIEIVGMARLEGDDVDYGHVTDITAPYNYTQILQMGVKITGSQMKLSQYGITNPKEYQVAKAVPQLSVLLEKGAFHGVRSAGSASAPRSFGGLGTFITNNTVAAGGAIAKTHIETCMEYIMTDGGMPDLLVVNPAVAADLKALIDTSSFVNLNYQNTQIGMQPVQRVVTQFGELQILTSRWAPVSTAYLLDSRKVGFYDYRPFAWEDMPASGDYEAAEVIGEFSFMVASDKAHGKITGITS